MMFTFLFRSSSLAVILGAFVWIVSPIHAGTLLSEPLVAVELAPEVTVKMPLIDTPEGGSPVAQDGVPFVGKWSSASTPIQFYTFTADSPSSGKMTIKIGDGKSKSFKFKDLNRKNSVFFVDGREHFYTISDDGTEMKLESEITSIRLFRED